MRKRLLPLWTLDRLQKGFFICHICRFCISDHHFIILPSSKDQHIITQAVVETTKILTELAVDKITREEEVDMSYFFQAWLKSTMLSLSNVSRTFPWTRKRTRCAGRLPLLSSRRIVQRWGGIFSVRFLNVLTRKDEITEYILFSLGPPGSEPSTKKNFVPVKKNSSLLPPASPLSDNSTQQGSPV